MSRSAPHKRQTIPGIAALKGQRPIVALTAYSAPMAALLDPHVDVLLVGDSLGMVLYGEPTTLGVGIEDMLRHGRAVVDASSRAVVIVDMPFGSYQSSPSAAFENAARLLKETGCSGVKLEGGAEMADTIRFLTERGIPVMAHIGLKPQHVQMLGGYRRQGKNEAEQAVIRRDALAVQEAGAFCVVMECVETSLAVEMTKTLAIPTIGIGCGPACDGQILVAEDMLGLGEAPASFVRQYADLRGIIGKAVQDYAEDVRAGRYPA